MIQTELLTGSELSGAQADQGGGVGHGSHYGGAGGQAGFEGGQGDPGGDGQGAGYLCAGQGGADGGHDVGFYGDEGVDAGEGFASNGESGVGGGQDLAAVGVEFNHVQGFVAGPSGGGEAAQQGFSHVASADDLQSCVHVEEST